MNCFYCGKEYFPEHKKCPKCRRRILKENKELFLTWLYGILLAIFTPITLFFLAYGLVDPVCLLLTVLSLVPVELAIIWRYSEHRRRYKFLKMLRKKAMGQQISPKIFAKYEEYLQRLEEKEQRKREKFEKQDAQNQAKWQDRQPISTRLISIEKKYKEKSGFGRALLGGMFLGELGAVIGAATGAKTITWHEATFYVKYLSGREDFETVRMDSGRYEELVKYLVE